VFGLVFLVPVPFSCHVHLPTARSLFAVSCCGDCAYVPASTRVGLGRRIAPCVVYSSLFRGITTAAMAPLRLVAALAAAVLVADVSAQAGDDSNGNIKVWATVAYINSGERTPVIGGLQTVLTPEGAQQLWRQGSAFRSRYLTGSSGSNSSSEANSTGVASIQNMAKDAIDNRQLTVLSLADEWVAAGALAFMQGLYPAKTDAFVDGAGGKDLSHDYADGGNVTEYPLNGYQYPKIQTLTTQDNASVGIQGDVACSAWQSEMGTNLTNTKAIQDSVSQSKDLYQTLFSSAPLQGTIPLTSATYLNAYEIYDLVSYLYTHNETVFKGLKDANNTLNTLRANAFNLERAKTSHNSTSKDDPLNVLYSIAGRTLAYQVANNLNGTVAANGASRKMTLMFGSLRPLLSFLSVGGLMTRENLASGPFSRLPEPGAAMVFELISERYSSNSGGFPSTDDLKIRFYYRTTANANETFVTYPLFGSGFDGPIVPYMSFVQRMQDRGTSPVDWCGVCNPGATASWCSNSSSSGDSSSGNSSISPAVGGVIGAIIMAALIGLVSLGLFALGGFRVFRVQRPGKNERSSTLSGFKGPERMAQDADVAVSKGGSREERIGSWEMRDGDREHQVFSTNAGIVTRDFHSTTSRMEEDRVSVSGAPVKARESSSVIAPTTSHRNLRLPQTAASSFMASEPATPPSLPQEPKYEYDPLPSTRSIRILALHPSADATAPLTGTLTTSPLDGPLASYETISYAWGTGPRSLALFILEDGDGPQRRALPLTQSIHDALCRVRRTDDVPRRLWADQVCINQEDLGERGRQVQLMNAVYKGAARILVWLGRDDEGVAADAARMVEHLDGVFRDEEAHERFRRAHSEELAKQSKEPWVPLSRLTRLPWFHRLWIVQEIGTSAPATLFWGASHLDWATLSFVADVLNQRYHHLRSRFAVGTPNFRYLYRRFVEPSVYSYDEHHNRGSFVYELHRARHMLARDPRDHVYAFLGHFSVQKGSWALDGLVADYARPVGDVYVDVAVRVLREATSLILLSATHNVEAGCKRTPFGAADLNLPSWVPDWRVLPVHLVGSPETPHRAGGDTQPQLTIDEERRILYIGGFRIDTIVRRSGVFNGKAFQFRQTGPSHPIEALWQNVCGYEASSLDEQYPSRTTPSTSTDNGANSSNAGRFESSAFFALIQTLTNACIGADRSRPYASIPPSTWLAHGASYMLRSGVAPACIASCVCAAARAGDPFKWSREATLVSRYRRFGVTQRAVYYVMGPDRMDEGDAVVVLHGGRTPFVLRRQDGGDWWVLVGECYVHGIMNGEALQMPDRQEEVFSIH
ncbi:Heterokaryon incompatibility protein 6, OR allele, partial [Tolypocladium ophioglossoides CBS 100239]